MMEVGEQDEINSEDVAGKMAASVRLRVGHQFPVVIPPSGLSRLDQTFPRPLGFTLTFVNAMIGLKSTLNVCSNPSSSPHTRLNSAYSA